MSAAAGPMTPTQHGPRTRPPTDAPGSRVLEQPAPRELHGHFPFPPRARAGPSRPRPSLGRARDRLRATNTKEVAPMAVASVIPVHLFTGGNQVPDVDPNEWLLSTGIRSASFQNVGDTIVGFIARQPEVQQHSDFETGELKRWSDGNPMMQLRVALSTDQRDPEDPEDSGER